MCFFSPLLVHVVRQALKDHINEFFRFCGHILCPLCLKYTLVAVCFLLASTEEKNEKKNQFTAFCFRDACFSTDFGTVEQKKSYTILM